MAKVCDCYSQSMAVKSDLSQAGFVANSVKSIWVPVQSLKWLGYEWDLLSIPVEKIDRLLASIDIVLLHSRLPARQGGSVPVSIISNTLIFGNVCKLVTKSLHRAFDRSQGWDSCVELDTCARKELEFWKNNACNGILGPFSLLFVSHIALFIQMLVLRAVLPLLQLMIRLSRILTGIPYS